MYTSSTIQVDEVRYLKKHLAHYSITQVCQLLNMSRSGYNTRLKRPRKSTVFAEYIKMQYWKHKARLGAPSLVYDARDSGYHMSEKTISCVLQQLGLRSKAARKFKYKTDSGTYHAAVPNTLDRAFNSDKPNIAWVSDITYIKRAKDCYIYGFRFVWRKVISRQPSQHIDRHLVFNTLKQALFRHRFPENVLIHSDWDSQYCSTDFKQLLLRNGLKQSMSRAENYWDNAVAESFFNTLKIILFMIVITKRGSLLIKHYLDILKSIVIEFIAIQPMVGYRQ